YIDITANAFLYNMVRIISGALMRVGQGKERPEWVRKVLLAQDRTVCSATAPSSGLYFVGPQYDPDYGLPSLDNRPRF
ncbi:MAG TPA: tRNA pseudouridine(38-40) synthase TruA, partial [Gammaproteobacteria bacterium]|nr:tRNA pseudouridine(38-40) synthase TruA [Gammaproteobacteria bacterium]